MNAHPIPRPIFRAITILVVWVVVFGAITTVSPLHMEAGCDPVRERISATLMSPILGLFGFAAYFGGARPSGVMMLVSVAAIVGLPAFLVFLCRNRGIYWTLIALHVAIVVIASVGFQKAIRYWAENP